VSDLSGFLQSSIWLIPLYPLVAFLLIVLGRWTGFLPPKTGALVVITSTFLGLLHTVFFLSHWGPDYHTLSMSMTWLQAGTLQLPFGVYLDATGMMMLLVVTSVSLLIQIYTHGYMAHDPGYSRFYAYLALFNFSMLALVLSSNLFQMYVFWEMVGVSSYLLIGFWFTRPSAAAAATKAFLMNRIGDFGLLVGILTLLFFTWHYWPGPILAFDNMGGAAQKALESAGPVAFTIMCLLIFLGPVAKSAQIPLHTWLPDAMEGPTPISALIHAATMVAAGVFLIARMYPVFILSPVAMTVIAWVGAITAFVAATIALTQVDIKKALAYSTMSQLGYMVMAMGIGAYTAGLFHLMTHAFFKAMLFLCSGSVIHGCHEEQDMRKMGGLWRYMPITAATYLIGTVAITGVFIFSGFWSKDAIISAAVNKPIFFMIAIATAGMTAFYMFRTYFMTFHGEYRGHASHLHESPKVMTLPLVLLAIPSMLIGGLMSGAFPTGIPAFGELVHYGAEQFREAPNFLVMGISSLVALGGFLTAWSMYGRFKLLDPGRIAAAFQPLYRLCQNKWYFDDAYLGIARKVYLPFADFSAWFDRNIIDGIVGLTASTVNAGSGVLQTIQNGRIQTYLVLFFGAIMVLALVLMWMV
jgi:NAD(P)H-quinone oxidoreductase subunit 5